MSTKNQNELRNELIKTIGLDETIEEVSSFEPEQFRDAVPWSEATLADAIAGELQDLASYDASQKQWYLWDGQLHKPVEDGAAVDITAGLGLYFLDKLLNDFLLRNPEQKVTEETNAKAGTDINDSNGRIKAAVRGLKIIQKRMNSNAGQMAVAAMLQRKLPLDTTARDADDKQYLVFTNGVLDMHSIEKAFRDSTGAWQYPEPELLEPSPDRLVWRAIPHNWNPKAVAPNWCHMLSADSFHDSSEARILEQLLGIGLSGQVRHYSKHLVSLYGATNSGKGVITELLERIYPDHVSRHDQRIVMKMRDGTEQARLRDEMRNSRVVVASECINEVDENFLLDYAGNGKYIVRRMQTQPERVEPQGIMVITSNDPLKADANKSQLRDRLYPVLMPYRRIPETHPDQWAKDDVNISGPYSRGEDGQICKPMDSDLPGKMDAEAEGISVRLIQAYQGAMVHCDNKLPKTEPMEARLREAAEESDLLGLYLREYANLTYNPGTPINKSVKVSELYDGYMDLCGKHRRTPMAHAQFGKRVKGYQWDKDLKMETKPSGGVSRVVGFELIRA